jgi:hypothetical protein
LVSTTVSLNDAADFLGTVAIISRKDLLRKFGRWMQAHGLSAGTRLPLAFPIKCMA